MNHENLDIEILVDAFVKGTITRGGLSKLEAWAHESESNRQYVRDTYEIVFSQSVFNDHTHYDVRAAIERFYRYISESEFHTVPQLSKRVVNVSLLKNVYRVAVLILFLLIPIFTYYAGNHKIEQQFAKVNLEAPDGSQLNLTLPDGTKVQLNSGSRLSYSQGYGIVDRRLILSGEGHFKVHHNDNFPFIIETKGLVLQDLGTEFDIRNYQDDEEASVNLSQGSVEIHSEVHPSKPIYLTSGECLKLNKCTGKFWKLRNDNVESLSQYMNDLNFVDMRIADIAKQLSRSYGIHIEVTDSVKDRRFYGFFNRKQDTLNRILKVISGTNLIKYRRVQNSYIIY